jgi:hypothetical protein
LFYFKDEWLACQQSWLYLESIFSAPGIERQLPNESKMFFVVDRSFKEIMQKTAKVRLAHLFSSVLPNLFQVIINQSSYHLTMCNLHTDSFVSNPKKTHDDIREQLGLIDVKINGWNIWKTSMLWQHELKLEIARNI